MELASDNALLSSKYSGHTRTLNNCNKGKHVDIYLYRIYKRYINIYMSTICMESSFLHFLAMINTDS